MALPVPVLTLQHGAIRCSSMTLQQQFP